MSIGVFEMRIFAFSILLGWFTPTVLSRRKPGINKNFINALEILFNPYGSNLLLKTITYVYIVTFSFTRLGRVDGIQNDIVFSTYIGPD